MMSKARKIALAVLVFGTLAVFLPSLSFAALDTPQILSYQGRLTDAQKVTVPDGARAMKFAVYDAAAAGSCLWSAGNTDADTATIDCPADVPAGTVSITVTDGLFNVLLGDTAGGLQNALPDALFNTTALRYLEITIDGEVLTPRRRIVSSATALQAGNASLLDGFDTSQIGGLAAFVPVTDVGGNLTLSADLTVDTSTLFVDASANSVGIGTTTPSATLNIKHEGAVSGTQYEVLRLQSSAGGVGSGPYMQFQNDATTDLARISAIDITNWGGALAFMTNAADGSGVGSSEERMRIDATGNVGIGTTTPSTQLEVESTTADAAISVVSTFGTGFSQFVAGANDGTAATVHQTVYNGSAAGSIFGFSRANAAVWYADGSDLANFGIGTTTADPVTIGTNNLARMTIAASGNVGIGTTGPDNALDVVGTIDSTGFIRSTDAAGVPGTGIGIELVYPTGVPWNGTGILDVINRDTDAMRPLSINANDITFRTSTTGAASLSQPRMTIDVSGNVGVGTSTPTALFSVGTASQFQVTATGNISMLNNVPYTFPSSQGDPNSILTNDGTGGLFWSTTGAGFVTLQNAYINSTTEPEITLNTTQSDITVQNAVGDTVTNFFVFRNGAGAQVARISAAGSFVSGSGTTTYADGTLTSTVGTYVVNAAGNVDIQDALNADSVTSDAGVSIAAGNAYTGAGAVTLSSGGAGLLTVQSASGTVTFGTTTALTATGALSLSSGAATALTVTSNAAATWGTSAGNLSLISAGAGTGNVQIGSGAGTTTPDLLVADVKSDAGDPAGTNGGMYYNTTAGKFRCFEGGAWKDCDTTGGTTTLQSAYNNGATITTAAATDIAFTLTSGDFTATGAGSVLLTPTGASSFTSGGALTLTAGAASTWGTTSGDLSLAVAGAGTATVQIGDGASSATPDLLALDSKSTAGDPTGVDGAMYYNASSGLFRIFEGGAWKTLCNQTDQACGAGTGSALSAITAAVAGNSIDNGDNAQAWNWTLTTAAKTAFTFGETAAAINGAGNQSLVDFTTLTGSTAAPIRVTNGGSASASINLTSTGDFVIQDGGTAFAQFLDDGTATFGKAGAAGTINLGVGTDIDTIHIADGTGADVVTIGQAAADVSITDAQWSISSGGTGTFTAVTSAGALPISSGAGAGFTLTGNAASVVTTTAGNLRLDSAAVLQLGTTDATSVSMGATGVTTTSNGPLTATQTLTASNGFTQTTGALSLTGTSGSIALTGFGTTAITSTNTTTNAFSFTDTALTTASLTNFTSTNNSGANTAWSANRFAPTNSQTTAAVVTGSIVGLDVQFTQNTSVAGNTETVARFNLAANGSASTDAAVASIIDIANNDTAAGNQITVTDGLKITGTNITNGINLSGTFGTNLITSTNFAVAQSGRITTAAGQGLDTSGAGSLTLGSTNATTIDIAGGSGSTGCTITNASGDLACSGAISFGTLSSGFTTGSVVFAGASGVLSQDNANFFWDDSTNRLGLGDVSPAATLTVGSGDKFQVAGADGDVLFTDDQGSITFSAADATNAPMIQMFASGTTNSDRMVIAHSASFPTYGLQYQDSTDDFAFLSGGVDVFHIDLSTGVSGSVTSNANFLTSANTTLGSAGADNVTFNAGTWTLANDLDVTLSGGVDGINFDSNTLSIDGTNNRVGIGTSAPSAVLDVFTSTLVSGSLVDIQSTSNTFDGSLIDILENPTAVTDTSVTGSRFSMLYQPTYSTAVTTPTISGKTFDVRRTAITQTSFVSTLNITGALASFWDSPIQTTGTITSSADVLQIRQDQTNNTGSALNVYTAGTGFVARFNDDGTLTDTTPMVVDDGGIVGIGTTTPGTGTATGTPKLELSASDPWMRVKNTNDSLGSFYGDTFSVGQLGMYNPTAGTVNTLTAGTVRSVLGFDVTSGGGSRVGSLTNNFGSPVYRNLLDDGTGDATISGDLDSATLVVNGQYILGVSTTTGSQINGSWTSGNSTGVDSSINLVSTGDFTIQDSSTVFARFQDNGSTVFSKTGNVTAVQINAGDITNSNSGAGEHGLVITTSDAALSGDDLVLMISSFGGAADTEFRFESDGNAFADGSWSGSGADFAEYYHMASGDGVPGELVRTVSGDGIARTSGAYDENLIGIISTNPGFVGGYSDTETRPANEMKIVALSGRVPTLVNTENGSIQVGDAIVASSVPGVGMRAARVGKVVGFALEAYSGAGTGTIQIFVNPHYYVGATLRYDGSVTTFNDSAAYLATGTASALVQGKDSEGITLRGSGWDGSAAQNVDFTFRNVTTNATTSKLALLNNSGSEVFSVNQSGDLMIKGRLYPSDKGVSQNSKYIFYDSDMAPMDYMRTNAAGWATGSYDFAELFPSVDTSLSAGELVAMDPTRPEHVVRATGAQAAFLMGIVSTRPGFLAGEWEKGTTKYAVALAGRVPTKVSVSEGAIAIGDALTVSSVQPGVAVKAKHGGMIVGYALDAASVDGMITVLVRSLYLEPTNVASEQASLTTQGLDVYGTLNMHSNAINGVTRILGANGKWEINEDGILIQHVTGASGTKNVYASGSPQATVFLFGHGQLVNGQASVELESIDPGFTSIINPDAPIYVTVTPTTSETNGLYVKSKTQFGFAVADKIGAMLNTEFDWTLVAYRKGYGPTTASTISTPAPAPVPAPVSEPVPQPVQEPVVEPTLQPETPVVPTDTAPVTPETETPPLEAPTTPTSETPDPATTPLTEPASTEPSTESTPTEPTSTESAEPAPETTPSPIPTSTPEPEVTQPETEVVQPEPEPVQPEPATVIGSEPATSTVPTEPAPQLVAEPTPVSATP